MGEEASNQSTKWWWYIIRRFTKWPEHYVIHKPQEEVKFLKEKYPKL
jgi:hypothetical protein